MIGEGRSLWTGTLRLGGQYGNASFSQSKNEYAEPCPGEPFAGGRANSANHQLRFNLNRRNWQQQPNEFGVNVTWVRPLNSCEGQGSNTVGFERTVTVQRGQQVSITGQGGLSIRLARR